ncbi:hypothetical protein D3C78_1407100 [compost metagenome]
MRESSWRRLPAAALRGLTNTFSPAASAFSFIAAKPALGINTSPRTSSRAGQPVPRRVRGMALMVRTLSVISSPVAPSPRVAACTSWPST